MASTPRTRVDEVCAVELAVAFCGFRNVDLFSQGVYQLRLSARGARSGRAALPFAHGAACGEANARVPAAILGKERPLPPHILDETGEFVSPSFRVRCVDTSTYETRAALERDARPPPRPPSRVTAASSSAPLRRYVDEELPLRDVVRFRAELPLVTEAEGEAVEPLLLQVKLLRSLSTLILTPTLPLPLTLALT